MQVVGKLRRIFDRDTKIKLILLLAAIIIGALLETLALSIISPLISILLDNTIIETNQYVNFAYNLLGFTSVHTFLALLTFLLAAVYIFRGVYLYIVTKTQNRFIARRQANISENLLAKILDYPYLYHAGKNLAEMQRNILGDVGFMFNFLTSILLLLTDVFMAFFIMVFLLFASPLMTFCVMFMALICMLVYFKAFRRQIRVMGEKHRIASINMGKAINQSLGGIKEIKVLRRESYFRNVFKTSNDANVKYYVQYATLNAVPKLVIESICFGGAFFLLGAFILGGADISEIVPQLSVFVLAAFRLLPAVSRMMTQVNTVLFHRASVNAVYKSLFEEEEFSAALPAPVTSPPAGTRNIIVSNVTFQYPNTPSPVLENISLVVPEKKSVALVGSSGAGKTTLADLILGILTPESGEIFYEGRVGYIPQNIYLLDESILENVAFGVEREDIDEAKVWRALEQAQLADFVRSLPNGLETVVGDRGVRLSGGQRQRVGIARAMYEDPPILVLDEATSSLDNDTEKAVMDAVMGFQGNKTMLIVAHRLSTIEHCDIVYKVNERGVERER
jgi:ABC-type multidrug transport system fused ATPase/permease subunit